MSTSHCHPRTLAHQTAAWFRAVVLRRYQPRHRKEKAS